MKRIFLLMMLGCCCLVPAAWAQGTQKLWYTKPAKAWTEALPVGNGRLGAMIFGGVQEELLQLNEATLWNGGPVRTNVNPGAYDQLQLVREALFKDENYTRAWELTKKMQGYYSESYLPLGDLRIRHLLNDTVTTSYYRDLDITNAMATTRFTAGGTTYTRQVISSAPDQVILIRLTADKPGSLNIQLQASSPVKHQAYVISSTEIALKGKAASHIDPNYVRSEKPITQDDPAGCRGMRFDWRIKASSQGGHITADSNGISITGATEILVYVTAATSFNGFDKCPDSQGKDETKIVTGYLTAALKKTGAVYGRLMWPITSAFLTAYNLSWLVG
ncbi:glycoside hydrolase family 95 protein [Paraflavitalea speifideaquila]|uniref:glycoside hydrolase family 95 protein n=1 Tax=Paraflavitalea speifideaquila TaxID=3076558 RepID=UPI0028E60CFA|nr:glycoside hydrolase family 95 protein [Paraflavitalea speifideiaquila]